MAEKERQLETEMHLLKLSENEKRHYIKEAGELKTALAAAKERNSKLKETHERQKQLYDTLIDKVIEQTILKPTSHVIIIYYCSLLVTTIEYRFLNQALPLTFM